MDSRLENCWRSASLPFMKSSRPVTCIVLRWLAFPMLCLRLSAATISLQAVADSSLYENKPDFNLGGATLVAGTNQQVSRSRALFRFDLTTVPADAVVTGVEVQLYCTRQPDPDQHGGPVPSDFSLHRLFVNWGEGVGSGNTGSVAMAGDATWNERHYLGTSWGAPGGLIGTDYADNPSATTSVGNVGLYAWGSSTELIGDVNAWLAAPSSNFGFILVNQSEGTPGSARRFASREQPGGLTPAPQLIITYSTIPEPSFSALIMLGLILASFRRCRAGGSNC